MSEKLFHEGARLTLDKAISIARTYESSQKELKAMTSEIKEENVVNFIRKQPTRSQGQSPQIQDGVKNTGNQSKTQIETKGSPAQQPKTTGNLLNEKMQQLWRQPWKIRQMSSERTDMSLV